MLEHRPWVSACLCALGATTLLGGGAALLLPPDLLDVLWALGDRRLVALLVGAFVLSACLARLLLRGADDGDASELADPGAVARADARAAPGAAGHLR